MKRAIVFFVLLLAVAWLGAQPANDKILLSISTDMTEVPLNRTCNVLITLEWSGNLDRYDISPFENPIIENFDIVGNSSSNTVKSSDGITKAVREYSFTLKPLSLGMGYVDAFIIKYTDLEMDTDYTLTTNRVEIKTVDPLPEPGSKLWIVWILIVPVVAAGSFLLISKIRKNNQEKQRLLEEETNAARPIEEKYLTELPEKIDINDTSLEIVGAFTELARLLRRYLNEKFNIETNGVTTENLLVALNDKKIDDRHVEEIKEILHKSDLVKFSGGAATKSELDRAFTLVEAFMQHNLHNAHKE